MNVLLAASPLLLLLLCLLVFRSSALRGLLVACLSAFLCSAFVWESSASLISSAFFASLISAFDIFLIVFGAVYFFELLKLQGRIDAIVASMSRLSRNQGSIILLLAWLLVSFFEGVAGFGTPAAIVAPLLVAMGFPPVKAVILCLMGDSAAVVFGAVGTPIIGGFSALESAAALPQGEFLERVGVNASLLNLITLSLMPLLMLRLCSPEPKPYGQALFVGVCFTGFQLLFASFLGPELASCLAAMLSLFCFGAFLKLSSSKEKLDSIASVGGEGGDAKEIGTSPSLWKSWGPYLAVIAILVLSRLPELPFKSWLMSFELDVTKILGSELWIRWRPLYNPGLLPFLLVALVIGQGKQLASTFFLSWARLRSVFPVLFLGIFMVYLMNNSGGRETPSMMMSIASAAASLGDDLWFFASPLLGVLGSFASGSATVSNVMFGAFQQATAQTLSLSETKILGLQAFGAAVGNMICLHNIVAALAIVGKSGNEAQVLRANLPPALFFSLLAGLCFWLSHSFLG